jgi:hypothetical protein
VTQYAAIERTTVALAGGALASGSALAQPDSPTAVPTEASGATGGSGLALLAFLVVALVGAGLVLAAVSALVSVALVEVFGPFGDRTHLLLPTVIGVGPTAVLVVSFGPELLAVLVLTELVALPATGLLLRRRYRRAE